MTDHNRFCFGPAHIVVVTGAGSGIGNAIARAFDDLGATVVLNGRVAETLDRAAGEMSDRVHVMPFDLTQTDAIDEWIEEVSRKVGLVRTIVANAGKHQKRPAIDVDTASFNDLLALNLGASFVLARAVARRLIDAGEGGDMQFVSSMAALFGIPLVSAYTASKAAVAGLTRQLAVEWGAEGLRVNAIAPGFIDTEMSRTALDNDPARKERVLRRTPLARLGTPEEIGAVSAFLSSGAASFVSGQVIAVDGGASVGF